jgi:hypothetical protein
LDFWFAAALQNQHPFDESNVAGSLVALFPEERTK